MRRVNGTQNNQRKDLMLALLTTQAREAHVTQCFKPCMANIHAHKSRDRKGNLRSPTRGTRNKTQHHQDLHGQSPLEARLHHRASKHRVSKFRNQGGNQIKQIEPKSCKQRRNAFAEALARNKAFKI
jgi:hypothetical protein